MKEIEEEIQEAAIGMLEETLESLKEDRAFVTDFNSTIDTRTMYSGKGAVGYIKNGEINDVTIETLNGTLFLSLDTRP